MQGELVQRSGTAENVGGKNVLNALAFCLILENHPDKLFLLGGVSISSVKLNILDCDGYGILNYFEGRCREREI